MRKLAQSADLATVAVLGLAALGLQAYSYLIA